MRERGLNLASVLLVHIPVAVFFRGWRVLARSINSGLFLRVLNQPRFAVFQDKLVASSLPRFYVIVMPHTLHFLLPCLALLRGRAQIILLNNGAHRWEMRILAERFPKLPIFHVWTLPLSSLEHGYVINLLLSNHRDNFGIIDHDCYIFDGSIFSQLVPASDECLLGLFSEESASVAIKFPLTYFLYFNANVLSGLMQKYRVGAQLYRETPPTARNALATIGLGPRVFWKQYHNFRDTLHVLLGVAVADGLKFRFLTSDVEIPAMHVGGTSIGTHHSKDMLAIYINLLFLELLDDANIRSKYAFLTAPLRTAADARMRIDSTHQCWQLLPVAETLVQRLRDASRTKHT